MPRSSREIIRAIEQDDWVQVGQTGSHVHFKHDRKPGKITVPASGEDSAHWHVKEYRETLGGEAHVIAESPDVWTKQI